MKQLERRLLSKLSLIFNFSSSLKGANDLGERKSSIKDSEVRCSTLNTKSTLQNKENHLNYGAFSPETVKTRELTDSDQPIKNNGSKGGIRSKLHEITLYRAEIAIM